MNFAKNFVFFAVRKNIFVLFIVLFFSLQLSAQESDSLIIQTVAESVLWDTVAPLKVEKIHSPKKAAWMSAVLPGLGQGYNKKYWKIPIVYAGFAGTTVGIVLNFNQYKKYRDEYRYRLNNDYRKHDPDLLDWGDENINANKLNYQRNMEIFILVTAAWYLINILDAVVDAHLMSFDVSDNLSLNIVPSVAPNYHLGTSSYGEKSFATANISFIFNLK